jgi:hypothetical protein
MYFKQAIAKVGNQIIEEYKKESDESGWELSFDLEVLYQFENLFDTIKNTSNYKNKIEIDLIDYREKYPNEEESYFEMWILSDFILEYIGNKGYVIN